MTGRLDSGSPAAGGPLARALRKPGRSADAAPTPVLRVLDEAGQLRWQVPVALWSAHREEVGGSAYPCQIPADRPFHLRAPLVFVGYGVSREGWDDYRGRRIRGAIAVIFTGRPRRGGVRPGRKDEATRFAREIQDKVANAKVHGAVAVLLERDPCLPPCQGDALFSPAHPTDIPTDSPTVRPWSAGELALPTFSIGTRTLEAVTALSSELFTDDATPGSNGLRLLVEEAVREKQPLGPVPLHLQAEVAWRGGQLRQVAGRRCDVWYQPGAVAAREVKDVVRTCDGALESMEKLLSARVDKRIALLLFPEWRSKLFCTRSLGLGMAGDSQVALLYRTGAEEAKRLLVHELCHIVAAGLGDPPATFNEGLATLVGDTLGDLTLVQSGALRADRVTAANLREGRLWTLKELLVIPQSEWGLPPRRPLVSYPEAASFCAYVIRQIGFPGFRDLYGRLEGDDVKLQVKEIERALGEKLPAIEQGWKAWLGGKRARSRRGEGSGGGCRII